MSTLNGKVAIVTGASKGIGAGIARQFAKSGASVVVNYSTSQEAANALVAEIEENRDENREAEACAELTGERRVRLPHGEQLPVAGNRVGQGLVPADLAVDRGEGEAAAPAASGGVGQRDDVRG